MKAEINSLLKERFDAQFAKRQTQKHPIDKYECLLANDTGKRFLAIPGSSVGPMTVTTAYIHKLNSTMEQVRPAVLGLFDSNKRIHWDSDCSIYEVEKGGKKYRLEFRWELYQSHSPRLNMDPAYRKYWLRVILK